MKKQTVSISIIKTVALILAFYLLFLSGVRPAYAAKKKTAKQAYTMDETTRLALIFEAFNETNAKRQLAGLPPLIWSQDLFTVAEIRSYDIVVLFDHTRPDGTSCASLAPGIMYGENILEGNTYNVKSGTGAVNEWMLSPGHRENILDASYTIGAVSLHCFNGVYYWAQVFG